MGGTGIALGRDGSAPFANPATIIQINDNSLAFSVNFFAVELTHFSDWHQPTPADPRFGNLQLGGTGITSTRLTGLPSTVCLFLSFSQLKGDPSPQEDATPWKGGRQKLAVCLAAVESEDAIVPALSLHAGTSAGTTAQDASLARKWNRTQVGPSYTAQINDALAVGASLHGAYTTASFIQDASSLTSASDGSATQSSLGAAGDGNSFDLTAILGATYRVQNVTLGASVQVPSLHVLGSYQATLHEAFGATAGSNSILSSGNGSFRAPPPVRIAVGAGGTRGKLTLEGDASFDFAKTDALKSAMQVDSTVATNGALTNTSFAATYSVRTQPVVNASFGGEYFVAPNLSLLGGFWTNLSALPPLSPAHAPSLGNLVQARTHKVGLSFGIGSYGEAGELLVGAQLGYGWGQAIVANPYVVPNDWSVVDTQSYSALFVIAGATNLRTIKRAIESVEDAVKNAPESAPKPVTPPAP